MQRITNEKYEKIDTLAREQVSSHKKLASIIFLVPFLVVDKDQDQVLLLELAQIIQLTLLFIHSQSKNLDLETYLRSTLEMEKKIIEYKNLTEEEMVLMINNKYARHSTYSFFAGRREDYESLSEFIYYVLNNSYKHTTTKQILIEFGFINDDFSLNEFAPDKFQEEYQKVKTARLSYDAVMAIHKDDLKSLASLLKKGANPDYQDKDGNCMLFHAAIRNRSECVKLLLSSGATYDGLSGPLIAHYPEKIFTDHAWVSLHDNLLYTLYLVHQIFTIDLPGDVIREINQFLFGIHLDQRNMTSKKYQSTLLAASLTLFSHKFNTEENIVSYINEGIDRSKDVLGIEGKFKKISDVSCYYHAIHPPFGPHMLSLFRDMKYLDVGGRIHPLAPDKFKEEFANHTRAVTFPCNLANQT